MDEQTRDKMHEIGDALRERPVAWGDIPVEQQSIIVSVLKPSPSFDATQREFLSWWWLPVTQTQIDEINALMPPNTVAAPRVDGDGDMWLCSDFLTDAVEPDGRLHGIMPVLARLVLQYVPPDHWPQEAELP